MPTPVNNETLHTEYEAVSAKLTEVLDKLNDQKSLVKTTVEKFGDLKNELKMSIDANLTERTGLVNQLSDIEQKIAGIAANTSASNDGPLNFGKEFTADQERIAEIKNLHNRRTAVNIVMSRPVNIITSGSTSGGAAIDPFRMSGITPLGRRRFTIRDLLNVQPLGPTNLVEFVRETGFTNNAAVVSENPSAGKPVSDITYEMASETVETIAHYILATKQVLDDASMLAGNINGNLQYGYQLEEEEQLLLGSGATLNLNGLKTQATAYSDPGIYVQSEQRVDRLRLAMLQLEDAEYMGDGIVLNHKDWAWIELLKNVNNNYLFGSPFGAMMPMLWGLPVVSTKTMTETEFLVGAFASATLWDRETFNIAVSTEDSDNFRKNMVTIRGEGRLALVVPRPESFVTGSFGDLPSSGG